MQWALLLHFSSIHLAWNCCTDDLEASCPHTHTCTPGHIYSLALYWIVIVMWHTLGTQNNSLINFTLGYKWQAKWPYLVWRCPFLGGSFFRCFSVLTLSLLLCRECQFHQWQDDQPTNQSWWWRWWYIPRQSPRRPGEIGLPTVLPLAPGADRLRSPHAYHTIWQHSKQSCSRWSWYVCWLHFCRD